MNTVKMKAVGLHQYLAIENEQSLLDLEIDRPEAQGRDLLVAVRAISVNPVDTKVRAPKEGKEKPARILGWDAAGKVVAVGENVQHYKVGDQVFYAGDITRPGSNSEFQLIDERIVGRKPARLDYASAAALPLTSITAWEALFERMGISSNGNEAGKSLLIIGGAGGVGSIAIQLAHQLAKLKVIATASRPETIAWCQKLGAAEIINHRNALDDELEAIGIAQVDFILCLNSTAQHWPAITKLIAPQGKICSIVDTETPVDLNLLKSKSATFVWEFMFTRSMFQTDDMIEQQKILNAISKHIDSGELVSTLNETLQPINAANLRQAHAFLESGKALGKLVLMRWA